MQVGRKAQGRRGTKVWVQRHGGGSTKRRRSAARCEKAIETAVRRAGKKLAREAQAS